MTHQQILAMLSGCDSQHPMTLDALAKKSGLQPDTLVMVLDQMQHSVPASINTATITKGGKTQMVIWPTGVIASLTGTWRNVINQRQVPQRPELAAVKTQPKTQPQKKETHMSASNLRKIIHDKIVATPGIARSALLQYVLQQCPGATDKQAKKAISNMGQAGIIRTEGTRGALCYYINAAQTPVKPAKPAPVKTEAPAAPVATQPVAAAPAPKAAPAAPGRDGEFSIMLSDTNHLHLQLDDEQIMLTPERAMRLYRFLDHVRYLELVEA